MNIYEFISYTLPKIPQWCRSWHYNPLVAMSYNHLMFFFPPKRNVLPWSTKSSKSYVTHYPKKKSVWLNQKMSSEKAFTRTSNEFPSISIWISKPFVLLASSDRGFPLNQPMNLRFPRPRAAGRTAAPGGGPGDGLGAARDAELCADAGRQRRWYTLWWTYKKRLKIAIDGWFCFQKQWCSIVIVVWLEGMLILSLVC